MPMRLDDGWNQIQFNLSDFTRRAYGTNYIETLRVQVDEFFFEKKSTHNSFSLIIDSCQLSYSTCLLFRSTLFGR